MPTVLNRNNMVQLYLHTELIKHEKAFYINTEINLFVSFNNTHARARK